ncbi:unnamed protein product, partial [marine sediment metagenome]
HVVLTYWHALARLGDSDCDGYRTACSDMVARFGETNDAEAAHWVAWTCSLRADAVSDWSKLIALAEKDRESNPNEISFVRTLGQVLYRARRFEEAIQRLNEADQLMQGPDSSARTSPAYAWYFLAMAHHKTGNNDEAAKWLEKATLWTQKVLAEHEGGSGNQLTWNRRLTLQLLSAEAEQLIAGSDARAEQQARPARQQETNQTAAPAAQTKQDINEP